MELFTQRSQIFVENRFCFFFLLQSNERNNNRKHSTFSPSTLNLRDVISKKKISIPNNGKFQSCCEIFGFACKKLFTPEFFFFYLRMGTGNFFCQLWCSVQKSLLLRRRRTDILTGYLSKTFLRRPNGTRLILIIIKTIIKN